MQSIDNSGRCSKSALFGPFFLASRTFGAPLRNNSYEEYECRNYSCQAISGVGLTATISNTIVD